MKKLNLFFIVLLVLAFTSCSDDDNDDIIDIEAPTASIIGTWIAESVDYSGATETEIQGQTVTADFVGEAFDIDFGVTFSEDPNELVSDGSYSIELTTTVAGQTTVNTIENITFLEDGTWEMDGNELSITNNGMTAIVTIAELSEDRLVLALQTVEDLSQPGTVITTTIDIITTYSRQQ